MIADDIDDGARHTVSILASRCTFGAAAAVAFATTAAAAAAAQLRY